MDLIHFMCLIFLLTLLFYLATPKAKPSKGTLHGTSPRDREMSARNNLLKQRSSRITYLEKQLEEIKKENRLLKRIQARQEKELDNVHGSGELPKMIHRHNEEVMHLYKLPYL